MIVLRLSSLIFSLLSLGNLSEAAGQTILSNVVTSCIMINSFQELRESVEAALAYSHLNYCPFEVDHEGSEMDGIEISAQGIQLTCDKKSGSAGSYAESTRRKLVYEGKGVISNESTPKCIIKGSARHFNILADDVMMFGFDIHDSAYAAVFVGDNAQKVKIMHTAFISNKKVDGSTSNGGGAIQLGDGTQATILHCEFTENEVNQSEGGAIHLSDEVELTIYRSYFYENFVNGVGNGGAISASSDGKIFASRSEFFQNFVSVGEGPAIFVGSREGTSSTKSCDGGENNACLNESLENGTFCDGFFYDSQNDCEEFDSACASPSAFPTTAMPTKSPSSSPTKNPTGSPITSPSANPSFAPTKNPTGSPLALPSANPSPAPTIYPTSLPSTVPSIFPSGSPSKLPTTSPSTSPTNSPTISQQPSSDPTAFPTLKPSESPSDLPSCVPSFSPSSLPSVSPSLSFYPTITVDPQNYKSTKMPNLASTKSPSMKAAPSSKMPTFASTKTPSEKNSEASKMPSISSTKNPSVQNSNSSKMPSISSTKNPSVHNSNSNISSMKNPSVQNSISSKIPIISSTKNPSVGKFSSSKMPSISSTKYPSTENSKAIMMPNVSSTRIPSTKVSKSLKMPNLTSTKSPSTNKSKASKISSKVPSIASNSSTKTPTYKSHSHHHKSDNDSQDVSNDINVRRLTTKNSKKVNTIKSVSVDVQGLNKCSGLQQPPPQPVQNEFDSARMMLGTDHLLIRRRLH